MNKDSPSGRGATPPAGVVSPVAGGCRHPLLLRVVAYGLLLSGTYVALSWGRPVVPLDDAMITYRYAQNLAEGRGLVYNPGERVLGTTSAGYALLLALLDAGPADVVSASTAINFAASLVVALLLFELALRLGLPAVVALLAAGACIVVGDYWSPAMTGMEMPLYAAVSFAAMLLAASGWLWVAGLLAGVACLIRPDAIVLVLALVVTRWLVRPKGAGPREALVAVSDVLVIVGGALLVWGPWLVWSYGYYGSLLPHTLSAKMGEPLFVERYWPITHWCTPANCLWMIAISWLGWDGLQRRKRGQRDGLFPRLLLPIYALGYLVAFFLARVELYEWYLMTITPMMVLAAFLVMCEQAHRLRPRFLGALAAVLGGLLLLGIAGWSGHQRVLRIQLYAGQFEEPRRRLGELMARCLPGREPVLLGAIGHVGFYYGGPVVDAGGLVTPAEQLTEDRRRAVPLRVVTTEEAIEPGDRVLAACYPYVEGPPQVLLTRTDGACWQAPADVLGPPGDESIVFGGIAKLLSADVHPSRVRPGERCVLRLLWQRLGGPVAEGAFPVMYVYYGETGVWHKDFEPFLGTYPLAAWRPGEVVLQEELVYCPPDVPAGRYPVEVGLYHPDAGMLPAGAGRLEKTGLIVEVIR